MANEQGHILLLTSNKHWFYTINLRCLLLKPNVCRLIFCISSARQGFRRSFRRPMESPLPGSKQWELCWATLLDGNKFIQCGASVASGCWLAIHVYNWINVLGWDYKHTIDPHSGGLNRTFHGSNPYFHPKINEKSHFSRIFIYVPPWNDHVVPRRRGPRDAEPFAPRSPRSRSRRRTDSRGRGGFGSPRRRRSWETWPKIKPLNDFNGGFNSDFSWILMVI